MSTVIVYDDFHKPGGYTLADYDAKWSINTLGEMAIEDTRRFDNHMLAIAATPFRFGNDSSVADHGKYLALGAFPFRCRSVSSVRASGPRLPTSSSRSKTDDWSFGPPEGQFVDLEGADLPLERLARNTELRRGALGPGHAPA